jgi:nitronate monooxygenase
MWPDRRIQDLFGTELPIIQAPMAGSVGSEMVIAVSEAGGLGSLPCAMLTPEQIRTELGIIRQRTSRPINLNFFCHRSPQEDPVREAAWRQHLENYFIELGVDHKLLPLLGCERRLITSGVILWLSSHQEVISFHFGLPEQSLLDRIRATGAKIISSATSVNEAAVARRSRMRCHHCSGLRSWRASRHVPV